jgi:Rrf2 family protein
LAIASIYVRPRSIFRAMTSAAQSSQMRRSSLMNVGRKMDYAVRALTYLAAQPASRVVPRNEIQDQQRIPPHFLSKILRQLVTAGFLDSVPGARGGFRLREAAGRITIRRVYECIEGPLCLMECIESEHDCCFTLVCAQRTVWRGAQAALGRYLDQVSIGDIADPRGLVRRLGELEPRHARGSGGQVES